MNDRLERLVYDIGALNPIQKRSINSFLGEKDDGRYAEFSDRVMKCLKGYDTPLLADYYNNLCLSLMREQRYFDRTKEYRVQDQSIANETVYQKEEMRPYVIGLLLSYLFWRNHYKMLEFYWGCLPPRPRRVLDVGAGHGLFSAEMLRHAHDVYLDVLDISDASLELTNEVLAGMGVYPAKVLFRKGDFLKEELYPNWYDFIVLGEIIEHVNDPLSFLAKASELLTHDGSIFMSTCANCPAPDHVYQFHSVDEIRDLICRAGLTIERDLVLPTNSTTINYCAKLSHGRLT